MEKLRRPVTQSTVDELKAITFKKYGTLNLRHLETLTKSEFANFCGVIYPECSTYQPHYYGGWRNTWYMIMDGGYLMNPVQLAIHLSEDKGDILSCDKTLPSNLIAGFQYLESLKIAIPLYFNNIERAKDGYVWGLHQCFSVREMQSLGVYETLEQKAK